MADQVILAAAIASQSGTPLQSLELGPSKGKHSGPPKPKKYHWYASRYMCAITLLVVLALTFRHLSLYLYRRWDDKIRARQPPEEGRTRSRLGKLAAVADQHLQRALCLTTLPPWLYGPDTLGDALFTGLYCGVLCYFCINTTTLVGGRNNLANQMGVMAFSQMPLILLLVTKNNPISLLTGITYQKLNFLHRAASRACLLSSWIHAVAWTPRVWDEGHFKRAYIIWGLVALFAFTLLWTTSFRIVRRVAWEFFILSHILLTICFLVGAMFHWERLRYWIWPALALWALDRALRLSRLMFSNKTRLRRGKAQPHDCDVVELIGPDVIRLQIRRSSLSWSAGQHAYLSIPSVTQSPHESHPFSFANVPTDGDNTAVFILRVHAGATRRLRDAVPGPITTNIPIFLEGPYGSVHHLDGYDAVLLLAGGTGITYCLSHFLALLHSRRARIKHLRLVWHVRQTADIDWITQLLNQATDALHQREDLTAIIDIFVTRSRLDSHAMPMSTELRHGHAVLPTVDRLQVRGHQHAPKIVHWHEGRAELTAVVKDAMDVARDRLGITVCGPQSLLHATRAAVKNVTAIWSPRSGEPAVDYHEETLGA